jgi:O-antigen ligase
MTGLTQHVNDLGGLTAIALVPSLMFATTARFGRSLRLVGVATSALILSGLILSGSVAGFAAAAAAVLGWLLMRRPDRRLVLAIGLLILAGLGSVALQAVRNGVSPAARLTNVLGGAGDRSSGHTRLEIDLAALQQIATHPILGVGLNNESYVRATGDLVHNVLLEVWLGGGTVALIGFVIMLAAVAYSGFRNVRELVDEERDLATSTFAAFCGLLVFGLAAPVLLSRYAWMPVAMLVILRQLRIQSNLLPATTKKSGDSDRA